MLVDPQLPAEDDRERFFEALDRDVSRRGVPVALLLTCSHHRRSADELAVRYDATVWDGDGELPAGVRTFRVEHPQPVERPLWLEPLRTLVVGDALTSLPGELRVWWDVRWPDGREWYDEKLLPSLRPLADLPAEHVIVGHGPPVAGEELGRALDREPHS